MKTRQTGELQEELDPIFSEYEPGESESLVSVLQDIQGRLGYLPQEAMRETARFLNVTNAEVYGVATFYTQFHLKPQGRHNIKVCEGTACHVKGGQAIVEALEEELGIRPGQTTDDLEFSLERVACFGSCALAPVMVVDGKVHGRMTAGKAVSLLEDIA